MTVLSRFGTRFVSPGQYWNFSLPPSALFVHRNCTDTWANKASGRRSVKLSSTDFDPITLAKDGPKPDRAALRREVLQLWRDCIRIANAFTWQDVDGIAWRKKLVNSARSEFQAARDEKDPEMISRMIITGTESITQVVEMMHKKAAELVEKEYQEDQKAAAAGMASPGKGRGPPGDPSKWMTHEELMKKEFMYRHQKWEDRQNLEGEAWRRQYMADNNPLYKSNAPKKTNDELKWKKKE